MTCPSCAGPLTSGVVDSRGHSFDHCRWCGARWSEHVSSDIDGKDRPTGVASPRRSAASHRAASGDWYEWKLGRRSFANEYRYRIA